MRTPFRLLPVSLVLIAMLSATVPADGQSPPAFKKKIDWPDLMFNVNVLGFAQLGPMAQLEINLTRGLYIYPEVRYTYAGWAAHELWSRGEDDFKFSPASFGAGMGVKNFMQMGKKNRALFYGVLGEFSYDKVWHNTGSNWEAEHKRTGIAAAANMGYRWWIGRYIFLHVGFYAGASFDLKNESLYITGSEIGTPERDEGGEYKVEPQSHFIGLFDLAFGWDMR